jgi:hypothetical protein
LLKLDSKDLTLQTGSDHHGAVHVHYGREPVELMSTLRPPPAVVNNDHQIIKSSCVIVKVQSKSEETKEEENNSNCPMYIH